MQDLCLSCQKLLPYIGGGNHDSRCRRCANTLNLAQQLDLVCGVCQAHPPDYHLVRTLFPYQFPVDQLIHRLKYQRQLPNARMLGNLWANTLSSQIDRPTVELLLPVPLHRRRLRQRGFNQSLELAKPLARHLNLTIDRHALKRAIDTPPQTELSFKHRRKNVQGAFKADATRLRGKRVAVVDDVMTTGSTVSAIATCLKKAGVKYCEVWVLARA
ncbi:MAG: ComF family protein [Gammaproteobacteria bacterium]|nr:ComF family protein [Gammaproteobacteria bacterium]